MAMMTVMAVVRVNGGNTEAVAVVRETRGARERVRVRLKAGMDHQACTWQRERVV